MSYKLADVVAATGVPAPTLLSWADRGYVPAAKVGRGNHRTFSLKDVDRIGIIHELIKVGLPISDASRAASAFSDERSFKRSKGQLHRDNAKTLLLVTKDGAAVHRAYDRAEFEDAISKLYADERTVIVLNIGETLARVDAALEGSLTPKPPAGAIYRHGRQLHT